MFPSLLLLLLFSLLSFRMDLDSITRKLVTHIGLVNNALITPVNVDANKEIPVTYSSEAVASFDALNFDCDYYYYDRVTCKA